MHSSISVMHIIRSTHSVKHFQVNVAENGDIILGKEHFNDLDSFQEHFNNIPLFRDETGNYRILLTGFKF